jgi:hypothetical protein
MLAETRQRSRTLTAACVVLRSCTRPSLARGKGRPGGGTGGSGGTITLDGLRRQRDSLRTGTTRDIRRVDDRHPHLSSKLTCYQGGRGVLDRRPITPGTRSRGREMSLQSGRVDLGAADCTAVLYYSGGRKTVTLATKNFRGRRRNASTGSCSNRAPAVPGLRHSFRYRLPSDCWIVMLVLVQVAGMSSWLGFVLV